MFGAVVWQRVEGGIILVASLGLFWSWHDALPWWGALLVFFSPDLSFLGYRLGPRTGAIIYNMVHLYAVGAALLTIGLMMSAPIFAAVGALWLAHAGFDRMLGYGLKSPEGFSVTHLGRIGRQP